MKKPTILLALLILSVGVALGQSEQLRKNNFNIKKSVALEGYDPVSYFEGKPREGEEGIRFTYKGITYQFSSQANLTRFKNDPDKYEPAYGGWCAFAMGDSGEKVKVDPETYKILDGKLYLFYNFWGNNTLESWNKNEKALKSKGDLNWKKIVP